MKAFFATACILAGVLLAGGCATKKYVRTTTAPIQAKVDQVGEQTAQNSQQIQNTNQQVKQVDERAQNGISAAQEKAATAYDKANGADQHAGEAMTRANQAGEKADQDARDIGMVRDAVANIDDYKLQTSATVLFKFDQYRLTDDAKEQLDKLATDAGGNKRFFIAVEGFTDSTGSSEYNEVLSRKRADAVVEYLVAKHDVPVYRIHMVGLGELKPADDAKTREARAHNRRVEVKVFSADKAAANLSPQGSAPTQAQAHPNQDQQ
jgi:outer membrane protein OmpA-like peptidoglycan-associated protein